MKKENGKEHSPKRLQYIIKKTIIQKVLTKQNQLVLYIVAIMTAVLSIADVVLKLFPFPVSITVYVCAAVSFFASCKLWVRTARILIRAVFIPFMERNKMLHLLIMDYRLRTVIMALPGLFINVVFAVFNAVIGIAGRSAWYGSLAAYYILLCVMRFISVMYAKNLYIDKTELTAEQRELEVYRNCGRMLSVMSISLMGAVTVLVNGEGGKIYHGVTIYAAAFYTFYKLVMSIRGMVRARREKSFLLITLRNIGHSEALVALLSLQTALFEAFGKDSRAMIPVMNAATGAVVCLGALVLGLHMVYDAGKRLRTSQTNFKGGAIHDQYIGGRG